MGDFRNSMKEYLTNPFGNKVDGYFTLFWFLFSGIVIWTLWEPLHSFHAIIEDLLIIWIIILLILSYVQWKSQRAK